MGDTLGSSVSLSGGSRSTVGAVQFGDACVCVLEFEGSGFFSLEENIFGPSDFGRSLDLSGDGCSLVMDAPL